MITKIKKQAKQTVFQNFKYIVFPTLLFVISNVVTYCILNIVSLYSIISQNDFLGLSVYALLIFCKLVCIPVSVTIIFKISILIQNGSNDIRGDLKRFFIKSNVGKIILINLLPGILNLIIIMNRAHLSVLSPFNVDKTFRIICSFVQFLLVYLAWCASYCFVLNECSIMQSVKTSFQSAPKVFGKYLLLLLSFMPWILLLAVIYIVLKMTFYGGFSGLRDYSPYFDILPRLGFGIDFFLIPYIYITFGLFFDRELRR